MENIGSISIFVDNERFLRALRDAPQYKDELADRLDVSKKTVYRRMGTLTDAGLVEKGPDGYKLTNFGVLQLQLYSDLGDQLVTLSESSRILELISSNALPPYCVFSTAEIHQAEAHDPCRPTEYVEHVLRDAAAVQIALPVFSPNHVKLHDRIDDTEIELVIHGDVARQLTEGRPEEFFRLTSESTVYQTDTQIPYGICLPDEPLERIVILVYGETNRTCAAVTTTTPEAIEWGREFYNSYRQGATRVRGERPPM